MPSLISSTCALISRPELSAFPLKLISSLSNPLVTRSNLLLTRLYQLLNLHVREKRIFFIFYKISWSSSPSKGGAAVVKMYNNTPKDHISQR